VVFESTPLLAGGVGNALYVVVWGTAIVLPLAMRQHWADWTGIGVVEGSMAAAVQAVAPGSDARISFSMGPTKDLSALTPIRWSGINWTFAAMLARLAWVGVSLLLAAAAAAWFDRFDSAPVSVVSSRQPVKKAAWSAWLRWKPRVRRPNTASRSPLDRIFTAADPLGGMVLAELRLALRGVSAWWTVVAVGLAVACLLVSMPAARYVFRVAWFWPLLIWSQMGVRESLHRTGALVFSSPRPITRQFLGLWGSGVVLAMVVGLGFAVRLVASGDVTGLVAWLAGACFIPSLALALGTWTTSTRAFEAIYTVWWYVGPMKGIAALDFTGAAAASAPFNTAAVYGGGAVALLALAVLGRMKQMR